MDVEMGFGAANIQSQEEIYENGEKESNHEKGDREVKKNEK